MTTPPTTTSPCGRDNILPSFAEKPVRKQRQISPGWTAGQSLGVRRQVVYGMFGKRHWASEWVLALCEADPRFLFHLAEQPPGYVHFVCLIKLALPEQTGDGARARHAALLRGSSKKKILRALWPSCPSGILGLLPKLPKKPLPMQDYRSLVRALENQSMRKLLHHKKYLRCIDLGRLTMIENLPGKFQSAEILNLIRDADDYFDLFFMNKLAAHLGVKLTKQEVSQTARNMRGMEQLAQWFIKKVRKNLPPPPWTGNELIKPVDTKDNLYAAADEFSNCAMRYFGQIVLGYSYFYVCASPKAMIRVVHDAVLGWGIREIEGVSSKGLGFARKCDVIRAFSDSGFYLATSNSHFLHPDHWDLFDR